LSQLSFPEPCAFCTPASTNVIPAGAAGMRNAEREIARIRKQTDLRSERMRRSTVGKEKPGKEELHEYRAGRIHAIP
jgi:hypothetical protein